MIDMKNSSEFYASIDIGTQNVVILVGKILTSGKLFIVAKSVVKVNQNAVVRGEIKKLDIKDSINTALEEIRKSYGYDIKSAFVALSGQHIVCEKHSGYRYLNNADGAVEKQDIEELYLNMENLKFDSGKAVISILPQSYILDDEEQSDPLFMIGNKLEGIFNIVIGDNKIISLFERVLKECNVDISKKTLSSIASSKAVLMEGEMEQGVMVVDIGAGTTDVAIYADDSLKYLGVIPIGGNIINKDIRTIGILEKYIEKLKVNQGNALSSTVDENISIALPPIGKLSSKEVSQKVLSNIIEARCVDIITYLIDILETTGLKNRLISGIVITGGCGNMKNINLLFEKYFDCYVRVASPIENVDEISYEYIEDPMYSTAIGLLLDGIESEFPSIVVKQEKSEPKLVIEIEVEPEEADLFTGNEKEPITQEEENPNDDQEENQEEAIEVSEESEEPEEPTQTMDDKPKKNMFGDFGKKLKKFITEIE